MLVFLFARMSVRVDIRAGLRMSRGFKVERFKTGSS